MSAFLKKLFSQTIENESVSSKKVNHVVVDIEITEHEYMAMDRDDEMVGGESFVFNGDDSPGFIRITVDGNEIEFDEDALSDRSKYSDYESFDLGAKWNSDDVVKFGYYDNLAGKTWEFDVENFDIEKLSFYYQCFDVKYGLADYDCEEHRITLRYAGEEIEEDYDAYSCENGEFEQEWCLYDDEDDDCCDDDDSDNSEDDEESSIDSVSRVFGILAFTAASLDDEVTEEEVGAIIGIANSFGFNVDLVKQAVMLEKMGIRSYDSQSELAASIPEEYYDNLFQGIIMVLIADFKLRQVELDFLSGLKDIWGLDDDYVDDVLNYHVQRLSARHPEREFQVEDEIVGDATCDDSESAAEDLDIDALWEAVTVKLKEEVSTRISVPKGKAYFTMASNVMKGCLSYAAGYSVKSGMATVGIETFGGEKAKQIIDENMATASSNFILKAVEPKQGVKNKDKWTWSVGTTINKSTDELVQWYVDTMLSLYRFFEAH